MSVESMSELELHLAVFFLMEETVKDALGNRDIEIARSPTMSIEAHNSVCRSSEVFPEEGLKSVSK